MSRSAGRDLMKKRILFLSDIDSAHTRKWAISLAERGCIIGIFSIRKSETDWFKEFPAIHVFDREGFGTERFHAGVAQKLSYLKLVPFLRKVLRAFQPDLVHAHYATSYGLLGVRSGFHPLIISVWGSDIFEFPRKSILHRLLVFNNLKNADAIFSTSEIMKREVLNYVNRDVAVTPFGVDTTIFQPSKVESLFSEGTKVVGVIKSLEPAYAIDVLIKAFALVKEQYSGELKLLICGGGTREAELKTIAAAAEFSSDIIFAGKIPPQEVPRYHNMIDIFANISLQESFGVAVVEAMACEKPVVATAVGGLKEVVEENVTGIFVPPADVEKTADAILTLLRDPGKAKRMGKAGRERVLEKYDWNKNLDTIENLYTKLFF
jgi:glycosyltransferase involved in cell wall biosynthesis